MARTILIAVDSSKRAQEVFAAGAEVARLRKARICLLRVVPIPTDIGFSPGAVPAEPTSLLADLVVAVHLAGIGFIAAGGLLAWRWPRLLWAHVPAVGWGVAIILIGFTCPLTPLEKYFRRLAGEAN